MCAQNNWSNRIQTDKNRCKLCGKTITKKWMILSPLLCKWSVMSINRALNVSMEGHKTTSAGRLFHTRIAAGKKLYWNALMDAGGTWNLWLWPMVLRVFGMRYDEAGIAINPFTTRYIMMAQWLWTAFVVSPSYSSQAVATWWLDCPECCWMDPQSVCC